MLIEWCAEYMHMNVNVNIMLPSACFRHSSESSECCEVKDACNVWVLTLDS